MAAQSAQETSRRKEEADKQQLQWPNRPQPYTKKMGCLLGYVTLFLKLPKKCAFEPKVCATTSVSFGTDVLAQINVLLVAFLRGSARTPTTRAAGTI